MTTNIRTAPNAAALNAALEAAGSTRWILRCGPESHLWNHMNADRLINWPASFADIREVVADALEEDERNKE